MSSGMMILPLFYMWMVYTTMDTWAKNSFNRDVWFDHGNIFHIDQEPFRNVFQQHRNVNRHIHWLANEISSLNHQIQSIKEQVTFVIHTREQRSLLPEEEEEEEENTPSTTTATIEQKNHQNIFLLELLSDEQLFDGYLEDLIDIYQLSLSTTIECLAIVSEANSMEKYLLIKLSNGRIDQYQMNRTKALWKIDRSILLWKNDGKQPEYYRRFGLENKTNEMISTHQLMEIKNRPKSTDVNFFDMMGQILRIKYHTDPSSLSCIFEVFFGDIYTCDGRLIHPHELKLLSADNNFFVFYGLMMDTNTERRIYPLDTNHRVRLGDQIFFLFHNHPQFQSYSSLKCTDCPRIDQTYTLNNNDNNNNNERKIEKNTDNPIVESTDHLLQNSSLSIPQNYIVYFLTTSLLIYILLGIYFNRKEPSSTYFGRKHSISSRRGR